MKKAVAVFLALGGVLWQAFVLYKIAEWFIMPHLEFQLPFSLVLGVMLLRGAWSQSKSKFEDSNEALEYVLTSIIEVSLMLLIAFVFNLIF